MERNSSFRVAHNPLGDFLKGAVICTGHKSTNAKAAEGDKTEPKYIYMKCQPLKMCVCLNQSAPFEWSGLVWADTHFQRLAFIFWGVLFCLLDTQDGSGNMIKIYLYSHCTRYYSWTIDVLGPSGLRCTSTIWWSARGRKLWFPHCALLTKTQKSLTDIPESVLKLESPHIDNEIMKKLGNECMSVCVYVCTRTHNTCHPRDLWRSGFVAGAEKL